MGLDNTDITRLIEDAATQVRAETVQTPESGLTEEFEWPIECTVGPGLEGAIACSTKIGYVNGSKGWLVYRGYDIFELCARSDFEEVSFLLLRGDLPTQEQLDEFRTKQAEYRHMPDSLRLLMSFPVERMHPMAALRMGANLMRQRQTIRDYDQEHNIKGRTIGSDEDSIPMETEPLGETHAVYEFRDKTINRPSQRKADRDQKEAVGFEACCHLIAGLGTLVSAIHRVRQGYLPIEPDPELSHAANLLYMMTGRRPSPVEERIMDIILILHADHGMNASTFAAMVVASTLSDIYFSIGAGVAALNGPLHGGANAEVLHMLRDIGSADRVDRWYRKARSERRKIMGFGHRVYKAYDPRARVLGPLAKALVAERGSDETRELLAVANRLEELVVDDLGASKGIFPNVDFYSGLVYDCLGIPADLFTPLFAAARVSGWSARVLEYLKHNRIFRPRAIYIGGFDRPYLPMAERNRQA